MILTRHQSEQNPIMTMFSINATKVFLPDSFNYMNTAF